MTLGCSSEVTEWNLLLRVTHTLTLSFTLVSSTWHRLKSRILVVALYVDTSEMKMRVWRSQSLLSSIA